MGLNGAETSAAGRRSRSRQAYPSGAGWIAGRASKGIFVGCFIKGGGETPRRGGRCFGPKGVVFFEGEEIQPPPYTLSLGMTGLFSTNRRITTSGSFA